ncbi:wax ester/triacylglycerol synthase domain-containing protein [Streptomyces sp. NPDC094032]|uniref:wax ester/triacylglycerol synthase domain-containing protein n=1 Tax=Streptomyces sp. NPDC094032 TaxID=3155308 RepID=UPI003323F2F6
MPRNRPRHPTTGIRPPAPAPVSTLAAATPAPSHRLGPFDRLFLAGGRPGRVPTAMLVLDFDGEAPHPARFAERILERARHLPALNVLRPEPGARTFPARRTPLSADAHVHHVDAATADGTPSLLAALLVRPFPCPPHPPWDLTVIRTGGQDARFSLCYRIHHAVQDGVGAAHTLLALTADSPVRGPFPHERGRPTVRGALQAARELARSPRSPHPYGAASGRFTVDVRDAREDRVRELARHHGSTVNDVCLAALALALGPRLHDGPRVRTDGGTLPIAVPMSYRTYADRDAPGNRMLAVRLDLPVTAHDLDQAVRLVRGTTEPLRRHRAKDSRRTALALLPDGLHAAALRTNTRATGFIASSLTFPEPAHVNGARMTGATALFPPDETLTAYVSFTRASGRIRCALVHDELVWLPGDLTERWLTALG